MTRVSHGPYVNTLFFSDLGTGTDIAPTIIVYTPVPQAYSLLYGSAAGTECMRMGMSNEQPRIWWAGYE